MGWASCCGGPATQPRDGELGETALRSVATSVEKSSRAIGEGRQIRGGVDCGEATSDRRCGSGRPWRRTGRPRQGVRRTSSRRPPSLSAGGPVALLHSARRRRVFVSRVHFWRIAVTASMKRSGSSMESAMVEQRTPRNDREGSLSVSCTTPSVLPTSPMHLWKLSRIPMPL